MDSLYKAILKNYSIKVADTTNAYDSTKEWIYTKIFYTLEDYIKNVLPIKIELEGKEKYLKQKENVYVATAVDVEAYWDLIEKCLKAY